MALHVGVLVVIMDDQVVSFRFIRHVIKNFSHFICKRNFTLGFSANILDL